ncbi:mucin-2-like isoform X2 [Ruditapes philippinarum]|uniref:mucin-2-like isoform X2 n=1 Tax=Ruditapes philippinarum TaxID=129788 RepID=UPI00295C1700|nr:mucin-2-like isoform X2 [Ruditapes philippinarum]
MIVTTLFLILFLATVGADECGDRCTSSQVCGEDDGICFDKSDLITCTSFTSIFTSYYCKKDQACCSDGCMPAGSVCCYNIYCASNHTCCSVIGCCPSGTFCSGLKCIPDIFSTQKPSTASPRTTLFRTTLKPWTTFNPWTTSKPDYPTTYKPVTLYPTRRPYIITMKPSASALKPWQYASIVTSVLVAIAVTITVVCLIRRSHRNRSNAQAPPGMILTAPAQVYGQAVINNGTSHGVSPAYTNTPPNGTSHGVPPAYTNRPLNGTSNGVPPAYTNTPPNGTSHGVPPAYTNKLTHGTSHGVPPAYTNIPPQQLNAANIATKPVETKPVATPSTQVNNKTKQVFSL